MEEHIEPEDLSLYVDRQGTEESQARIKRHLDRCRECSSEFEEIEQLKINLGSLSKHYAPPDLVASLRRTYLEPAPRPWFTFKFLWKPIGAFAVVALAGSLWMFRPLDDPQDHVDMDALLEAHSKYQMESLVPRADMARSDYSARLASFYRDEE